MKIQDIVAAFVILMLLTRRGAKLFVYAGLVCFLFAMPLFARWVFFTAERLVWYGTLLILIAIIRHASSGNRT